MLNPSDSTFVICQIKNFWDHSISYLPEQRTCKIVSFMDVLNILCVPFFIF